ncbi:hypothetical protein ABIB62_003017 [Mucilaginibacter sp. UYP25]|uniref:DUF3606 domain-containing protein n=1 Tax=unclassified Mucilaginibacter TaxID=2617802 RepID=UPI003390A769
MTKKRIKATADARTVDIEDQHAIDFWTKQLGVTELKLRAAVKVVGNAFPAVKRELKK